MSEINYSSYLTVTPEIGGEYYRLDIPVGVTPPTEGTKINLSGTTVVSLKPETPRDIAKGRGGPIAKWMEARKVAYLVNCLPEGHKWLPKPVVRAEIVRSHKDMATGLMDRKHLPKNAGMLFDFGSDQPLSFWMKNTYIPLQIAFIDSKGVVKKISSMSPLSTSSVRSTGNCRYALEVNEGWFDEHNVRIGATVAIPGGGESKVHPPDEGLGGEGDAEGEGDQPEKNPQLVIEQSFKDILVSADANDLSVVVEYVTKDGNELPPKMVSPPFSFGETNEGDVNGLVTVWDDQLARYTSLIVDNIVGIKDQQGNPIPNSDRVVELAKGVPNKVVDNMFAKGKLPQ